MSAVTVTTCAGCEKEIPPSRGGRARKWCSERCRKVNAYSRRCVDCGAVCNTDGRITGAAERCRSCAERHNHETRRWTPETIAAAIRLWADEHGGVPPTATDWLRALPREFPHASVVMREFGTWNAGLTAAGFETFKPGHYGREGEDPAIVAETIRLYRTGLSADAVGERMGISAVGVLHRLKVAGEPRRPAGGRWRSA